MPINLTKEDTAALLQQVINARKTPMQVPQQIVKLICSLAVLQPHAVEMIIGGEVLLIFLEPDAILREEEVAVLRLAGWDYNSTRHAWVYA